MVSYGTIFKTETLTATPAGVDLGTGLETLAARERVMLLFYPSRSGDVELRQSAGDASTRHLIPQNAGGDAPYQDGPWIWGDLPKTLYATVDTNVTMEIIQVNWS